MSEGKVVSLRGDAVSYLGQVSLPLFKDPGASFGTVAFLDLAYFNQDDFLGILGRNPITGIIDVRDVPVFQRPQFRHAEIADYLYARRICYLDFTSTSAKNEFAEAHISLLASQPHQLLGKVSEVLERGLTIVIYDNLSIQGSIITELRRMLSRHSSFRAEMHPNTLGK